jgi:hypothetical protein
LIFSSLSSSSHCLNYITSWWWTHFWSGWLWTLQGPWEYACAKPAGSHIRLCPSWLVSCPSIDHHLSRPGGQHVSPLKSLLADASATSMEFFI